MALFYGKKKKIKNSEEQVPRLPPDNPQPSTQPSILEAEKLLCASLAPSKCTVFLENYSREFASQLGDAAAAHIHLCSGTCPCIFGGGAVVYEGSSSCLTCRMPVVFKSCCFCYKHL